MTTKDIQALGSLLATYHSDLTYIRDFHRHKNEKIVATEYLIKSTGSFKSFIDEFRVARNVDKTKTAMLLGLTTEWIKQKDCDNVDGFAEQLKDAGITHGKVMTSLASKVLFLNNPWTILPLDNLAKQAVGLRNNKYTSYLPLTRVFIADNQNQIAELLSSVNQHLTTIEKQFEHEIENLEIVRHNRFVDKLLWTSGRVR